MASSDFVQIVQRIPGHDAQVNEMYTEVFGDETRDRSLKRWDWQYLQNPNTDDSGPVIWIAVHDERVIGQLATMPFGMWWGGRELRASAAMDFMVRTEARGRGVGVALSEAWVSHVDVGLGLGLAPSSYGLFSKMFTDVGPVPAYLKILDASAVARRRWGRVGGTVAAPLIGAALVLMSKPVSSTGGVDVSATSTFSDEYDDLWCRVRDSYGPIVRRDAAYLTWKYSQCPFRRYRVLAARTGGALSGFVVIRSEGEPSFRRGIIVDLLCDTADVSTQDALIEAALSEFRAGGAARAETYCFNDSVAKSLRRHGFRRGRTNIQYCVAHRHVSSWPLSRRADWSLMLGDGDLDRA